MPELPDIEVYRAALAQRLVGRPLQRVRIVSPFVLRTVEPPIDRLAGKTVRGIRRLGKRIVFEMEDDLFLVVHLMIAGRFRWFSPATARLPGKISLAAFDLSHGTLVLTEAGTKKRAAMHLVHGEAALRAHDPGGVEPLEASLAAFRDALVRGNHTLKRALTDPRRIAGIGNAYSDEILHAARLSPIKLTSKLTDDEIARLHEAAVRVLTDWSARLREQFAERFPGPGDITAFRDGFAVHGRYRKPCPDCGAPVQRIRYAENDTNYCPGCQTNGRILADRSLSRLLKGDWPKTVEEL